MIGHACFFACQYTHSLDSAFLACKLGLSQFVVVFESHLGANSPGLALDPKDNSWCHQAFTSLAASNILLPNNDSVSCAVCVQSPLGSSSQPLEVLTSTRGEASGSILAAVLEISPQSRFEPSHDSALCKD
ncbi:hypothetical protein IAQ61_001663 [Plenodomus lingam]|uniref:uncharacterized protein n=1 Tax=Leptosphaeria maculans TaxID=5022 RepID=UPI00332A3006|nr:hypothetical protein IAQ61_001663 [Plenodomus lingam]